MKLKSVLLACLSFCVLNAYSQNAFNPINGFTLTEAGGVFVSTSSEKAFIAQRSGYFHVPETVNCFKLEP